MCSFFDLNIPFLEGAASSKSPQNTTRLKLCAKLMELGYTGIGYNQSIRGVMSDSDYCSISLLSLPSLLELHPYLSASSKFHRGLLGVPISSPFRQYRRLTVSVESSSQVSALNSGNPILKTYDLVAVKPLNQNAFDQACQVSEVDIITIDFSKNLQFRLKQPIIKAAIQRGLYFEITYSNLVGDVQSRKQVISNAKLLVEWTRGKNLIVSSGACFVNDLRGPCDISNLLFLLGLSMEHAKAALSKNCWYLIDNALRKKKYYKAVLKFEPIISAKQYRETSFAESLKWDPISSIEGDLLFGDSIELLTTSSNVSKTEICDDIFDIDRVIDVDRDDQPSLILDANDVSMHDEGHESMKAGDFDTKLFNGGILPNREILSADGVLSMESLDEMKTMSNLSLTNHVLSSGMQNSNDSNPLLEKCISGNVRRNRKASLRPALFPFKCFRRHLFLKKKARALKTRLPL